jgi:hypothetical protein
VYAETRHWNESAAFWEGLGFAFADRWGSEGHRAGRLESGDAVVVLAEITEGDPDFTVFFDVSDPEHFTPGPAVETLTPLTETHWGTRWIRVQDPESRTHVLESR